MRKGPHAGSLDFWELNLSPFVTFSGAVFMEYINSSHCSVPVQLCPLPVDSPHSTCPATHGLNQGCAARSLFCGLQNYFSLPYLSPWGSWYELDLHSPGYYDKNEHQLPCKVGIHMNPMYNCYAVNNRNWLVFVILTFLLFEVAFSLKQNIHGVTTHGQVWPSDSSQTLINIYELVGLLGQVGWEIPYTPLQSTVGFGPVFEKVAHLWPKWCSQ